jgi:glycosyltransferase involved in cell wall biosynthesis
MLAGRKDPFATLAAWRRAQELDPSFDAELILKTGTVDLHPKIAEAYRNVTVITETWPREKVVEFYADMDCLVSTSRGEGNNKPAMEFMATGGPVMAPMWGGHVNWLHPDSGYPLAGMLQPVAPGSAVRDFRVDVEMVAQTFLHVWRNPAEARRKGELAARMVRADLSWEKVCDRFLQKCLGVM